MGNTTLEMLKMWQELAGEPKKQEVYVEVNGKRHKVTKITIENLTGEEKNNA